MVSLSSSYLSRTPKSNMPPRAPVGCQSRHSFVVQRFLCTLLCVTLYFHGWTVFSPVFSPVSISFPIYGSSLPLVQAFRTVLPSSPCYAVVCYSLRVVASLHPVMQLMAFYAIILLRLGRFKLDAILRLGASRCYVAAPSMHLLPVGRFRSAQPNSLKIGSGSGDQKRSPYKR